MAAACDLLPTFAKLAGAELPKNKIDGKNIWPLMSKEKNAKSPHTDFYYYRGNGLRAIRSGKWKLHIGNKNKLQTKKPSLMLYNLAKDISEKTDVSANNQETVKLLYKRAQEFDIKLKENARPPGKIN